MRAKTFRIGGVHPPENKHTDASRIIEVELPRTVALPLSQHIGAPATPIVKVGDIVTRGMKVAEAAGRVSAPVHTPISGTVTAIGPAPHTSGVPRQAIFIKADDEQHAADMEARSNKPVRYDYSFLTAEQLIKDISDAGIVGLGGATFPTAVKLSPPPGFEAKLLIINGAECEPFLTCDDALMRAHAPEIIEGVTILLMACGAPEAVIGIEENKPEAIKAMTEACSKYTNINVTVLQCKYPQGGEKQLINAITGLEVPSGALPIATGCIVQNVATAYAVYEAIALHKPLYERVMTVAGVGNFLVPMGMNISELPIGDPYPGESIDAIIGGPMMGRSASTLDAPILKGTSGLTIKKPMPYEPDSCIRCGECVRACPMGLQPYLISTLGRLKRADDAKAEGAMDCIDCGSCSFACPSGRPVVDYIRIAKLLINKK